LVCFDKAGIFGILFHYKPTPGVQFGLQIRHHVSFVKEYLSTNFVHLFLCFCHAKPVSPFVTKLRNTIFWKHMNQFWCKLSQVVHGARALNDQLWRSKGQRSRWQKVKDLFGGLASITTRWV